MALEVSVQELLAQIKSSFGCSVTLGLSGAAGVGKTSILREEVVEMAEVFWGMVIPKFKDEAQALLDRHLKQLEGAVGRARLPVAKAIKKEVRSLHPALAATHSWLWYCREYNHPVDQIVIGVANRRPALEDSAEIAGYPEKFGGSLIKLPPQEFPVWWLDLEELNALAGEFDTPIRHNGVSPLGVMVLDEPNRARPDAINACFSLVEKTHQVGFWQVDFGWTVLAAFNIGHANDTNELDAAFIGRTKRLELVTNVRDLVDWGSKKSRRGHAYIHPWVRAFLQNAGSGHLLATDDHLRVQTYAGDKAQSPRDWESLSEAIFQSKFNKNLGLVEHSLEEDDAQMFIEAHASVGSFSAEAFLKFIQDIKSRKNLTVGDIILGKAYTDKKVAELVAAMDDGAAASMANSLVQELERKLIDTEECSLGVAIFQYLVAKENRVAFHALCCSPDRSSAFRAWYNKHYKNYCEARRMRPASEGGGLADATDVCPYSKANPKSPFTNPVSGEEIRDYRLAHYSGIHGALVSK